MNKIIKFAKLDFITIKPYLTVKNLLIIIAFVVLFSMGSGDAGTIIGILMMYASIFITYPFVVSDKNKIDHLYASLPLSKRDIVIGRYLFAFTVDLAAGAGSAVLAVIAMIISGKNYHFMEIGLTVLACFLLFSMMQAVQLPIFFKLGYTKGKFLSYLPIGILAAVIGLASSFIGEKMFAYLIGFFDWIAGNAVMAAVITLIIWLVMVLVSCHLAHKAYTKSEL